jgi:hypothetical protein
MIKNNNEQLICKHWKGNLTKENIELFRIDVFQLEPKECLLVFKVDNKDIDVFNTPYYCEDFELIRKIEILIQQHYLTNIQK